MDQVLQMKNSFGSIIATDTGALLRTVHEAAKAVELACQEMQWSRQALVTLRAIHNPEINRLHTLWKQARQQAKESYDCVPNAKDREEAQIYQTDGRYYEGIAARHGAECRRLVQERRAAQHRLEIAPFGRARAEADLERVEKALSLAGPMSSQESESPSL